MAAQPPSLSATAIVGRAALRTEPGGRGRQRLERRRVQPHEQPPVADRDRRRHGALGLAHGRLRRERHLEVLRVRQPVADQRRLERDHRPAVREGRGDLGGHDDPLGHGRRDGHAASVASPLPCAHAGAPTDDARGHPPRRRGRGARPLDRRSAGGRRPPLDQGRPLSRPPVRDRPRSRRGRRGPASSPGAPCATPGRGCARMGGPSRSSERIPGDEDAPARIGLLDLRRPGPPVRFVRTGDHGAVVELAWSPDGRRLAFTAEVDPPRFIVGPTTPVSRRRRPNAKATRRDARATSPAHHPDRLALGRRGPPRPLVAPVRRRFGRRAGRAR